MASVRVKILKPDNSGLGRVYYQIIHKRVVRRILTDIRCIEVGLLTNSVVLHDLRLLNCIIEEFEQLGNDYACTDIIGAFCKRNKSNTFEEFFRNIIFGLEQAGRIGSAKTYRSALASFIKFTAGSEHHPSEITPGLIIRYRNWMVGQRLMENTTSFYMRHLRAVYRMMVAEGLVRDSRPFAGVFTGIAKTRKRAIRESELALIKRVDLSNSAALTFTRDLFMLSFYCMGMPFVDLAYLRKSEVTDHRIVYARKKTGQTISLKLHPKIKAILRRYPSPASSPYVLPIIKRPGCNERTQYENALRYANLNLKTIAKLAGVESNISTYTPRHTWASIAKQRQVNLSTISDALGNENESTTQIYLATLDNSHVDRANESIIKGF